MARHASSEQIARWNFLSRWLRVLRTNLCYVESDEWEGLSLHSSLETLCVFVPYPIEQTPEYDRKLQRLREAMELIGLALKLDRAVWYHLVDANDFALATFNPDDYYGEELSPRFLVKAYNKWNFGGDSLDSLNKVEHLLLDFEAAELSDEYHACRAAILAMDDDGVLTHFQIPIALWLQPHAWIDTPLYMARARDLTTKLYWTTRRSNSIAGITEPDRYPFRLEKMGLYASELEVSDDLVETLDLALDLGLTVPEISFESQVYTESALTILCTKATASSVASHRRSHVESIIITRTDLPAFRLCCQCLMTCQSLRRVKLISSFEDDEFRLDKWRELGRAFFSADSTCAVRELHIDEATLLIEDVDALRQGMQGKKQQSSTRRLESGASIERYVRFDSSALLNEPSGDESTQTLDSIGYEEDEWAKVLVDDSGTEWMQVELPFYGARWVECSGVIDVKTVTASTTEPPDSEGNSAPRVTSLRIAIDHCELRAMPSLVTLIGASLRGLHIVMKDSSLIQQDDIRNILRACPLLEFFHLRRATLTSMKLFIDAYETNQCRLSTLSLWNVDVSNASLRTFAERLADRSHRMTQTLREFRYIWDDIGCPGDVDRPDVLGIEAFLSMLPRNNVLSFFELGMSKALYRQFVDAFEVFDGVPVVDPSNQLTLRARLAFVSCVEPSRLSLTEDSASNKRARRSSSSGTRPSLDSRLVQRIFSFCDRRVRRVVSVAKIVAT
ncbi:hypothetical protein PINS_up010330 [Pythium insidiosum]|nr:hypothetical protein PINS_up010330 [Pythium insidiosum]